MFWILIVSIIIVIVLLIVLEKIGNINEFTEVSIVTLSVIMIVFLVISFGLCFACVFTMNNGRVAERMYPIVKQQVVELEERYGSLIDKYIVHEQDVYDSLNKDNTVAVMKIPEQKVSETLDSVIQRYTDLKNQLVDLQLSIVKGKLVRYYLFFF